MSDLKFGLNQPRTIRHHAHPQATILRRIPLDSHAVIRDGHDYQRLCAEIIDVHLNPLCPCMFGGIGNSLLGNPV